MFALVLALAPTITTAPVTTRRSGWRVGAGASAVVGASASASANKPLPPFAIDFAGSCLCLCL